MGRLSLPKLSLSSVWGLVLFYGVYLLISLLLLALVL